MELRTVNITDLKPYKNNPRKNEQAVDAVANSIKEFGFKVPIIVDKDNVIVTGHTRLLAAKKLGLKAVPCIMADDLTEEQVKAFRLADNKVAELAEWDFDLLDEELADLDIDMTDFGFEFVNEVFEHEQNRERTKERLIGMHNLGLANYEGVGKYDMPMLSPVKRLPKIKEWIGFNYVLSDPDPEGKAVHFFIDDYQFERIWNDPDAYIDKLKQYVCVATPDFSPYEDMPMATQIFNHYRKQWVGKYLQNHGVTVIPTVRASADERSLEWYLDGIPEKGIVIISSMWTGHEDIMDYFKNKEYATMYRTLSPCKVFLYGRDISDQLEGKIEFVPSFTAKRWSE